MNRHTGLLDPSATALLVVDVQERFRPVIDGFDDMVAGCARLVRTFRMLQNPVLVTEQYPRGLGKTVGELMDVLGDVEIPAKTAFSSMGCGEIPERLRAVGVRKVLVCGIETHVCVNQTVHDLLAAGYGVHVATDAVASRRASDKQTALRRLERVGAVLTTCEMAAFELVGDASHPAFKDVQALYK